MRRYQNVIIINCMHTILALFLWSNASIAANYKVNISYTTMGVFKDWNTGAIIKSSICTELPLLENATLKWDYAFDTTLYAAGKLYFKNGRACDVDGVFFYDPADNSTLPELPGSKITPHAAPRERQQSQKDIDFYKQLDEILNRKDAVPTVYENTEEAVNATAAAAYKTFPFLNMESPKANLEAIEAVIARRDEYINAGYTLSDSLLNAVNDIGPLYDTQKKKKRP